MKNIGFLSYWGFGRGMSHVTLNYAKMLAGKYGVHVMKVGKNVLSKEFVGLANVTEVEDWNIDPEVFRKWIKEGKLDAVVFNEYKQWGDDNSPNLIDVAKEEGCKIYAGEVCCNTSSTI